MTRSYSPLVAALWSLGLGCATWRTETVSPRRLIEDEQPRSVRVVLKDSSEVLISDPVVRSDSIVGAIPLVSGVSPAPIKPLPVAVALEDVASVAVSGVDERKTLMFLVPMGILLGGAILLAT